MRFTAIVAAALSVASVSATKYANQTEPAITTTVVVSSYTTYCSEPTTIVEGSQTYTVTEPTTLTVTNCPCTRTQTYTYVTSTVCADGCKPPSYTSAPPPPPPASYPNATTTHVDYPSPPSETAPGVSVPGVKPNITNAIPPPSEGAAASNKVTFAGAALAALVGIAAYVL